MRFFKHGINDVNIADLKRDIASLDANRGRLVGIVDDEAGGIIAYAIGEDNAAMIIAALNGMKQ